MNDFATVSKLADIEARVLALETKVASLPDISHIEERIKANQSPPVDPTQAPSFKDIELPIPSVNTIVTTAKTTWAALEMFAEMKTLLWMLVDRRYHMGWLTRLLTIGLVLLILFSHFIWPFANWDKTISPIWDKLIDLVIGLILFMVLHFEMRRYKEWRSRR